MSVLVRFRRALVVGCGRSGIAAAELLVAAGCEVTLYDRRSEVSDLPARLHGCAREFGLEMARDEVFERIDLLVLSPGVPPAAWLERRRMLVGLDRRALDQQAGEHEEQDGPQPAWRGARQSRF